MLYNYRKIIINSIGLGPRIVSCNIRWLKCFITDKCLKKICTEKNNLDNNVVLFFTNPFTVLVYSKFVKITNLRKFYKFFLQSVLPNKNLYNIILRYTATHLPICLCDLTYSIRCRKITQRLVFFISLH